MKLLFSPMKDSSHSMLQQCQHGLQNYVCPPCCPFHEPNHLPHRVSIGYQSANLCITPEINRPVHLYFHASLFPCKYNLKMYKNQYQQTQTPYHKPKPLPSDERLKSMHFSNLPRPTWIAMFLLLCFLCRYNLNDL